ncbi:MAG: PEP/pyruvate-binding domain-containing protein [Actinomycetota bacterium]
MIIRLDGSDVDGLSAADVGGKALGLARLASLGLPVPPAVAVPSSERGRLAEDPADIADLLGEPLAVRSSAVAEDAADRSAAGQFDSVMGVRRNDLREAVARVFRSATGERAVAYGGATASPMAVVIQRQIEATRAGVAFSRDPMTGGDEVVVECVFGHGERVVSGAEEPDRYVVGPDRKVRARMAERTGPFRTLRTLRDDEAALIAELTGRAEDGFGRPVDVEFCFDGPSLWLVQARPITTL